MLYFHQMIREADIMSKYDAFSKYLLSINTDRKELSIDQIENIVGELPPTARSDRTWWGNTRNQRRVQAKSWMSVGWLVDEVILTSEKVVFKKAK